MCSSDLHPTAFAAWVGFLVTALNLLPAGQLDGGHIARALLGPNAKYASWAAIAALIGLSFFYWSWLLFAILILFLGAKHPPPLNDITGLDTTRKMVGVFAFVVLIVAFVPVPMAPVATDCSFELTPLDGVARTVVPGQEAVFTVRVENTGNTVEDIMFEPEDVPGGWTVMFRDNHTSYDDAHTMKLNVSAVSFLTVLVTPDAASPIGNESVTIGAEAVRDLSSHSETVVFHFSVVLPEVETWLYDDGQETHPGSSVVSHMQLNNTEGEAMNLTLAARDWPGYLGVVLFLEEDPELEASHTLDVSVPAEDSLVVSIEVLVWASASPGEKSFSIDVSYQGVIVDTVTVTVVVL